jgi:hypothetical protein
MLTDHQGELMEKTSRFPSLLEVTAGCAMWNSDSSRVEDPETSCSCSLCLGEREEPSLGRTMALCAEETGLDLGSQALTTGFSSTFVGPWKDPLPLWASVYLGVKWVQQEPDLGFHGASSRLPRAKS